MNQLNTPTPVGLSAQAMVNTQGLAGGTCNGGDPAKVYEWAYEFGIPDSSCEQYAGENLHSHQFTYKDMCRDCLPPIPAAGEPGNCSAVPHKKYYVSEYYPVQGVTQMKSELAQHGPIGCGIDVTD